MSFIKISVLLFFVMISNVAFANAGGGEAAAGGEKKEKKEKSSAVEYVEKTTKLNTVQARIQDAEKDFAKLVEEKEHEKDQKKKDEIIKELIEISKKRNKDVEEYNRIKQELLYQYPAKNAELNKMYETEEKKSVDEMQGTADIDDMLGRVKKVIERKFAPFNPENDKPKPAVKSKAEPEEKKKLRLER